MPSEKYNGWTNWETLNVALWLCHDEGLYTAAREAAQAGAGYEDLAIHLAGFGLTRTPDGVELDPGRNGRLDVAELDEMMKEL